MNWIDGRLCLTPTWGLLSGLMHRRLWFQETLDGELDHVWMTLKGGCLVKIAL